MGCKSLMFKLFFVTALFCSLATCQDEPPPPPPGGDEPPPPPPEGDEPPPPPPPPGDILPPGSVSYEMYATPDIQNLINRVKSDVETQLGQQTTQYVAVKYRVQTVAGFFYWVKVNIGNEYIHMKIFEDIMGDVSLVGIIRNKSVTDPIEA